MRALLRVYRRLRHPSRLRPGGLALLPLLVAAVSGCHQADPSNRVIYLEGAGWFGSIRSVRSGLRTGGYPGVVESFTWTSFLGAPADHFVAARSSIPARRLAKRITDVRQSHPGGRLHLIGLSSGTAPIVNALEMLPDGVTVDHVVMLQSSLSARRDLTAALTHVRGRVYAVCSPHDNLLLGLPVSADGEVAPVVGLRGLRLPHGLSPEEKRLYSKVVNLPWRPAYAAFGWDGGHFYVTQQDFIAAVIAPRLRSDDPFPLDRPLILMHNPGGGNPAMPIAHPESR